MKQILVGILIAFVFLSSTCKKDIEIPDPELKKIFGKWEWIQSCGGFAGGCISPATQGYTISIEFSSNGIYKKYKNNNLVDREAFSFSQGTCIHNHQQVWFVSFTQMPPHHQSAFPMSVSFSGNDTLMLDDERYDGFGHIYARIK